MEFTLTKTPVKCGKYEYKVFDTEGNMISRRTSKRDYVACTIMGDYYFGRLDLIGKGEHGRMLNKVSRTRSQLNTNPKAAYAEYVKAVRREPGLYEEFVSWETRYCDSWEYRLKIAYLKNEQA